MKRRPLRLTSRQVDSLAMFVIGASAPILMLAFAGFVLAFRVLLVIP